MDISAYSTSDWKIVQRIAFRFPFCYFALFITFDLLPHALDEKLWFLLNLACALVASVAVQSFATIFRDCLSCTADVGCTRNVRY